MAKNQNQEDESNPLLPPTPDNEKPTPDPYSLPGKVSDPPAFPQQPPIPPAAHPQVAESFGWTADGLPMGLVAHPFSGRAHWSSGLCSCLGANDEFCSSDLEVCLLGSVAPCVLYGSNAERLEPNPGNFPNHCMTYTALFLIGNSFFGWNCLAPWFSYTRRTALRRRFNLEGSCEALNRQYGCCGSMMDDEVQREHCETACDFATHVFCHPCSLCQEGREIRRRLPHPGFHSQPPLILMVPPGEQSMGR